MLSNVAKGDPHVAAHNDERQLINAIQSVTDPAFSTIISTMISDLSGVPTLITLDTGEVYKVVAFSDTTLKAVPASAVAPEPPTDLTTTIRLSSITVSWSASPTSGARYDVYRDGLKIATTTGISLKDPNIATGSTYSYSVIATDVYGQPSDPTEPVVAFVDPALNGPPTVEITTWPSPLPSTGGGVIRVCAKDPDAQTLSYSLSVDAGLIEPTDDPSVWTYTAGG